MSPVAAVGSLYARSSGTWILAVYTALTIGAMLVITRAYASVLEVAERESLMVLGLALGMAWIPLLVGLTARRQLADARERLLPSATTHARVAILLMVVCYAVPSLAVAAWLGGDIIASAGTLGVIGACLWRLGWSEGRSHVIVLPAAILFPQTRVFRDACLHGGNPLGSYALLIIAALTISAVVVSSLHEQRSDHLRLGPDAHWLHRATSHWWRASPLRPFERVGTSAWSWARHLSRGWRADIASPSALVVIGFIGSSCASLIAAYERWSPADLSEASLSGVGIVGVQWLCLLATSGGSAARADAARPLSRRRFAAIVMLVAARSLVSSWAALWTGAMAGLWLCSGDGSSSRAFALCAQHLALLPIFIANLAWALSLRGAFETFAMMVISQILLIVAILPMLHAPDWMMGTGSAAMAAGEVCLGTGACWLVYRRWRTLEIA